MPPSSAPPPLVVETLTKVRKLRDALQGDDDGDDALVLAAAQSLLDQPNTMNERLQESVSLLYVDALLRKSAQLERIPELIAKYSLPSEEKALWHAYACYRLEKYHDALQALPSSSADPNDETLVRHLQAQCLYRQGDIAEAEEVYDALLRDQANQKSDNFFPLATNWVATQVANAVPVVTPPPPDEGTPTDNGSIRVLDDMLANTGTQQQQQELPFELIYNLATWRALTGQGPATTENVDLDECLQRAEAQTGNLPNSAKEVASVKMNRAWAHALHQEGRVVDAATMPALPDLPPSGKVVALANKALAMVDSQSNALKLLPTAATANSKFNPLQTRLLTYNRAILQYKSQQWDACVETCRSLSGNKAKMGGTDAKHWWDSRILVLQTRALLSKGGKQTGKVMDSLHSLLTTLRKQPSSPLRDDAIAYVQCHMAAMEPSANLSNDAGARLAVLDNLPESWASKPAVVASKAAAHQELGQLDQAQELVQGSNHPEILADLWLAQGDYERVVALYENMDLTEPVAQARYARALTYANPSKAVDYWASVGARRVLDQAVVDQVDGAELEKRPLPRLRTTRETKANLDSLGATAADPASHHQIRSTKSHDAILRRRARQREAYLSERDRRGLKHTEHPDPERWLPKYERSYNRRRRGGKGGGLHKGAQGGVSDKDAARLDVAARQAARAAGETGTSSSTAHIAAVSSGGPSRKGGRRR